METRLRQSFQTDLRLPKPVIVEGPTLPRRHSKWNLLKLFESVQGRDLHSGNPWLVLEVAKRLIRDRPKTVRFNLVPAIHIIPSKQELREERSVPL